MKLSNIFSLQIVTIVFVLFCEINSQCCLQFLGSQCLSCPQNMHIYRGNCIYNILNCNLYSNGFDCSQCNKGYKLQKGTCSSTNNSQTQQKQNQKIPIQLPINHTSTDDRLSPNNNSGVLQNSSLQQQTSASQAPKYQQQYLKIKMIQLSDIDALMDICFVLGLNQINNQVKQLQGLVPFKILAQEGYNSSSIKIVHYIISFQVNQFDGLVEQYQVKLRVDPMKYQVKIDAVTKRGLGNSVSNSANSSSNDSNSGTTALPSQPLDKQSQRSNYTQISPDPSQADIYFLIFLDGLGKSLQKELLQTAHKPQHNQMLYAGKYQAKDFIDYWVQTLVTCQAQIKNTYKIRGTISKTSYQVSINEISVIKQDGKLKETSNVDITNTYTTTANSTTNVSGNSTPQLITPSRDLPLKTQPSISKPANSLSSDTVNTSSIGTKNLTILSSNSTGIVADKQFQTSKDVLGQQNTRTPNNQSNSTVNEYINDLITTKNTTSSQKTTLTNANTTSYQLPIQTTNSTFNLNSSSNVITGGSVNIADFTATSINMANTTSKQQYKPAIPIEVNLYSTETYKSINRTLFDMSKGFDQINTTLSKDQGVTKVVDTLLSSRPGKQEKRLYKAFIKNIGIKAQYKIYFIDNTSNPQRIQIFQGYASYNLLRKRVFVIMFGLIST